MSKGDAELTFFAKKIPINKSYVLTFRYEKKNFLDKDSCRKWHVVVAIRLFSNYISILGIDLKKAYPNPIFVELLKGSTSDMFAVREAIKIQIEFVLNFLSFC